MRQIDQGSSTGRSAASHLGRGLAARAALLAVALVMLIQLPDAGAVVSGTAPTRFRSFRIFGDAVATGNTLMSNTPSQPLVNSILLNSSSARVQGVPQGATVEGAFLFWSGSIQNQPDRQARLELADGFSTAVNADTCFTSPVQDGFFYCRADVTSLVSAHPRSQGDFNGLYTVSDVQARAAALDNNGQCININCQARYAGWSLVVVHSSEEESTQRDIVLYDGFRQVDEDNRSAGIDSFTIGGFEVASPPQGTFTFFGLEGDALLGVPPQDQDADPQVRCSDCFDFISINGQRLSDSNNPPGNIFNSTTPSGGALGVDIDTFDVSNLFRAGDTSAAIQFGSGDGRPSSQGGGGESVFLGYVLLSLNRLAPNFQTRNTLKSVDPSEAGPGETVFFEIELTNDGSLAATQVVLTDALDSNLIYVPNSTRVDGVAVADVNGRSPLANGLRLGTVPSSGDNDRSVTFRATIAPGTAAGTRIPNQAFIASAELTRPVATNTVIVTTQAPTLGQPTKSFNDINGAPAEPGDIISYTIFIPNESGRTASGVSFVDDMPPFVQLLSVSPTPFDDRSDPGGGANGTGRVEIRDILIPAELDGVFLNYSVRVFDVDELLDAGVGADDIDGLPIANQGRVLATFLPTSLLTDNPATNNGPDPTIVRLESAVNFRNPQTFKRVEDVNGGSLVPGDTLRYTLGLRNSGNAPATVNLSDDLPPQVENFTLVSGAGPLNFAPAPAGANGTGRFTLRGLEVGPGESVEFVFTVDVADSAPGGLEIQNVASLAVPAAPDQNRELVSDGLTVSSGADLSASTKSVIDAPPGGFQPGDEVTWELVITNSGNRPATDVVVEDNLALNLENVRPQDGGVFDEARRRVTWSLGDLGAGETRRVRLLTDIVSGVPNGTRIRNQGLLAASNLSVRVATDDPATVALDDATTIVVRAEPSLVSSTKVVEDLNGQPFEPGDQVRYTLTVRNTGRAVARDVAVVDPIDENLTVDTVGQGGIVSNNRVVWRSGAVPQLTQVLPGEEVALTFVATIRAPLADGTVISNQANIATVDLVAGTPTDDPNTPAQGDPTVIQIRANPDLSASLKEVVDENGGAVQPGDLLTYTLTVQNNGNGLARGVVITDPIDSNLRNIAPADGGVFDEAQGLIRWTLAGPVQAGESATVSFRALVAEDATNGAVISNQATIASADLEEPVLTDDPRNGVGDDDPTRVTVEARPDFVLSTKVARNESREGSFQPGDQVLYVITVRNTGTQQANEVRVEDPLPPQLENVQVVGGSLNGDSALWTLPSLAAGQEIELEVRGTLRAQLDNGTQVSNQAFITSREVATPVPTDNPNTPDEDDATRFTVSSQAILMGSRKLFSSPSEVVRPGDEITWTLELVNTGTSAATDVVVTDVVDAGLTNVRPLDGGRFDANTRTLTWDSQGSPELASVSPDPNAVVRLRFLADVVTPLDNGTVISNQAQIIGGGLAEVALTDDPRTVDFPDATSFPVISAADFSTSTKEVLPQPDGAANPGDTVRYVLRVTNTGDAAATNVVVEDVLDENLIFTQATDGGTFAAPSLRWDAGTTPALARVEPGQTLQLGFEAVLVAPLADGTEIFNQGRVSADGFVNAQVTDDPGTEALDDPTVFQVSSQALLGGSTKEVRDLDGDGFFEPGDVVEYVITVRNNGDDAARQVVVRDQVDTALLTDVVALDGGVLRGDTLTWDSQSRPALATLAPGEASRQVLRFRATISPQASNRAQVNNQAFVSAQGLEAVPTDDPATPAVDDVTTFVVVAEARLDASTKAVEDLNGDPVQAGDVLRYTLVVRNEGTEIARAVQILDPIDDALIGVRPLDGGVLQGSRAEWSLGDLAPGESRQVRLEAQVRGGVPDGLRISNQALIQARGLPGVPTDDPANGLGDDDATTVIVNARPDLSLFTKEVRDLNGGFVRPGDEILYTLVVRNTGQGAAREVLVRDPLDTALLTDLAPGQRGTLAAGVATWTQEEVPALASLEPGENVELTIRARIRDEVPNNTILANQANLIAAEVAQVRSDDPNTADAGDSTRLVVSFPEFQSVTKNVEDLDGGFLEPGDVLRYTLEVLAAPGEPLVNVAVVDPIEDALIDITPAAGGVFSPQRREIIWNAQTTPALGQLSPGRPVSLTFTARIDPETPLGTRIANQATASTAQDAGLEVLSDDPRNGVGDRDATVVVVDSRAVSSLSNTTKRVTDDNGGTVEPGDTLTWTIEVPNEGRAASGALTLVDPTPALTSYVPGSTLLNGGAVPDINGSPLATGISISSLEPGEVLTVSFQTRVSSEASQGLVISNQGVVTDENGVQVVTDDPSTANVDDATQVVVGAGPNITGLRKVAGLLDQNNNGQFDVGDLIRYEIRVPNRGTVAARRAVLRDTLPEELRYRLGSLRVNGVAVTDADDDDFGFVQGNEVTVFLGSIEPGEAPVITLDARILRGPVVINQGTLSGANFGDELTDEDGNQANGDQPTRTVVGGQAGLAITKVASDSNGDNVEPGDELVYTIQVQNPSGVTRADVAVQDALPQGVSFVDAVALPPGAVLRAGDQVTVSGFSVPAGETRVVALRVRISEQAAEGLEICNEATVSQAQLGRLTSEQACVTVGGALGLGRLTGLVFAERGDRDGVYTQGEDEALADFLVRAYRSSDPGSAVAEAISDSDGLYRLPALGDGSYVLKVFSRPFGGDPVEFAQTGAVQVREGAVVERDLLVDPSGRIYNSVTGELINGAEVQIYYDESDPDPLRAGRLVPPQDLPEGQQSQLTRDGFYRFDVLPGHIYRLEVVAPNQSLVFPSTRIRPEGRAWNADEDPGAVVDSEIPDLTSEARYFVTFDIAGADVQVIHNHIPLDPLSSLVQLDKRASARTTRIGELVTYTISVVNNSSRELVYDENSRIGGVYIRDVVPRGFQYVKGSARVRQVVAGQRTASLKAAPRGELTLEFGRQVEGQVEPLSLGAGQTLELQYQLVAGVDVEPGREYTNRAILVTADGSSPISNEDTAKVRVVNDPIFDEGLVLGKVFCDTNGDGWQDEGEPGIYRARVYLDNGWYAVTDSAGKFHVQAVEPGTHLIKLDVDTLPPGAQMTTDVRRVFYVTRGLPVKLAFGATCPVNEVSEVDVNASKAALEEEARRRQEKFVTVSGDIPKEKIQVGQQSLVLPRASLSVSVQGAKDKDAPLAVLSRGKLRKPLVFAPTSFGDTSRWAIQVKRLVKDGEQAEVYALRGEGAPPAQVIWDGAATDGGAVVLGGPEVYQATLVSQGAGGRLAVSAPAFFGVGAPSDELEVQETLRGALFGKNNELSDDLKGKLRSLKLRARTPRLKFEVEVHTADLGKPEQRQASTDAQAQAIARFLADELKLDKAMVSAKGFGDSRPLVPNSSDANRDINTRVEVRVTDPKPEVVMPRLPSVVETPQAVYVNDKGLKVAPDGTFSQEVLKPEDGLLVLEVVFLDGSRAVARVNARSGAVELLPPEFTLPEVPLKGDLGTGTFNLGRATVKLDWLALAVEPAQRDWKLEEGRVEPRVELKLKVPEGIKASSYAVEIRDSNNNLLYQARGQGSVPATVSWDGTIEENRTFLIPGWYQASLEVRGEDGQVGRSQVGQFRLVAPEPAPARGRRPRKKTPEQEEAERQAATPPPVQASPSAFVNGLAVEVNDKGGLRTTVRGYTGQKVLLEVVTAQGARARVYLPIPNGFAKPLELDPGQSQPVMGLSAPALLPLDPDAAPAQEVKPPAQPPAQEQSGDEAKEEKPEEKKPEEKKPEEKKPAEDSGPVEVEGEEVEGRRPQMPWETLQVAQSPEFRVLLAQSEGTSDAAPAQPAAQGQGKPAAGSLEGFGGDALEEALRGLGESSVDKDALKSAAANLKVQLPPQGTKVYHRELVVRGATEPTNKIKINGVAVEVVEGSFVHVIKLEPGLNEVLIESEDVEGNKGVIRWPVEVAQGKLFLMAFGEAGLATEGAELDGLHGDNSTRLDNGTLLFGQGRLYLKGYRSGKDILDGLFKEYRATGFVDTSRQQNFEDFLTDTVQDDRYYPIYGDSGEVVRDANARGKVYVLLEADESKVIVGNTRAGLQGVQFFRYDRPFYGAKLDLKKAVVEGYQTEVKAFVSDEGQPVVHTYNFLQGTGGSIYWLRNGEVVEGSEKLTLVVKDGVSGIELARVPQVRNTDYTIDYATGRVLFKTPVPSVMTGAFLDSRFNTTRQTLDGNPVIIEASYDYESRDALGEVSWGAQGRQTIADVLQVGGGYVREGRSQGSWQPDYELWSVDAALRYSPRTELVTEYAQSQSRDTLSLFSSDGGLSYDAFARRTGRDAQGSAWLVRGKLELADLLEAPEEGKLAPEILSVGGYVQQAERGFFANGNVLEQGQDKFGVESVWVIDANNRLRLRHDGVFTRTDDFRDDDPEATKIIERQVSTLQHVLTAGDLQLTSEYARSFYDDETRVDGYRTDQVHARLGYRLTENLTAFVGQQWVIQGDPRIYDDSLDHFQTEVGLSYRFFEDWSLEAVQSLRWNGENSTQLGLSTQLSPNSSIYVRERLVTKEDNDGLGTTTVVGGEQRFADNTGRLYSEYHVDTGLAGDQTRSIIGVGKRFTLSEGLTLDVAAERSDIKATALTGDSSRTVGSVGWEYLIPRTLKFAQKLEVRYDDADASVPQDNPCFGDGIYTNPELCRDNLALGSDKLQVLTTNALVLTFWDDHNLLAKWNLATTENLTFEREEARTMSLSFGYALRPVSWDWFNFLFKYTWLQDLRPLDLVNFEEVREHSHVLTAIPIVELPWNLQLVEKLAFKRQFVRYGDLPEAESDTWLWINRVNYHLTGDFDAAFEYRLMHNSLSGEWKHGPLVELTYILMEHARLGVGYNFTSFSDDEFSDLDRDVGGFFFRVQGQY